MELIDIIPEFNLYEEFWKVYTKCDQFPPQYIGESATINRCIIGEGTEIYGEVSNSVIGSGVVIEEGAVVRNSIIMSDSVIGKGTVVDKSIVAENVKVGENCVLGTTEYEYKESKLSTKVYASDLVTIAENSVIPDGVKIGINTAISGVTTKDDYTDGSYLDSGDYIVVKEGASR